MNFPFYNLAADISSNLRLTLLQLLNFGKFFPQLRILSPEFLHQLIILSFHGKLFNFLSQNLDLQLMISFDLMLVLVDNAIFSLSIVSLILYLHRQPVYG